MAPASKLPTFTISLDLELHWGVFDKRTVSAYRANLDGTRAAVHAMLQAFSDYGVHATWATVGLLMCASKKEALSMAPPIPARPNYQQSALDPYQLLTSQSEADAAYYFAPELIEAIHRVPGQEIATHTFGHIYALEDGMTPDAWNADLEAAQRIGTKHGITFRSIVFPRNQWNADVLDVCAQRGIRTFRGQPSSPMYAPRPDHQQHPPVRAARLLDAYIPLTRRTSGVSDDAGMKNVAATGFLRPYSQRLRALDTLRVRRIIQDMLGAIQRGENVHIWWHPHNFGIHLEENIAVLTTILRFAANLRERGLLQFATMDACAWPNQ